MRRKSESGTNMSSCRIERKRAHDREAQRASRAKTKAYIAHLEKTVADLSQSSGDGRANYLAQHASHQQNEIDALQGLVSKIRGLVQDATGKLEQQSPNNEAPPRMKSEGSIDSGFGADGPLNEAAAVSWDSPPGVDDWIDLTKSTPNDETAHPVEKAVAATRNLVVLGVNMLCENTDDTSYFSRLNDAATKVEKTPDNLSSIEEDEDIVVRAIVQGWDAAERVHHFDIVWRFIRAFDEGLWIRTSPQAERLAHTWNFRRMMLWKIQPKNQPRRKIPSFMEPTPAQRSMPKRYAIIDYFGWPQVRDQLLVQGIENCPGKTSVAYAESFRFVWPYELRDAYKLNRATGMYSLSEALNKAVDDLSAFRMLQHDLIPPFVHPSLAHAVAPPKFDHIAECESPAASDDTTNMSNETVAIPSLGGLTQGLGESSWAPPYTTIDVNGSDLSQFMDFYAFNQEVTTGGW